VSRSAISPGVLAAGWAVYHLVLLALICAGALIFAGFGVLALTVPDSNTGQMAPPAVGIVIIAISLVVMAGAAAVLLPALAISLGLARGRMWGKLGAFALAVLHIWHLPFGTLLSVLTFVHVAQAGLDDEA
jgi:hypothetical protein